MTTITPFKIDVSEDKLERLKQKLLLTDLPDELADTDGSWDRGVPLTEIKRLTNYWAHGFDWRKAEAKLNELPQYITIIDVDGFDKYNVHFTHHPSTVANAIPLLFIHGWPGGFFEVTKMLPELGVDGKSYPSFHVVAPSLIDFGFSSSSKKEGFGIDQQAEVCHKLMLALGYNEYVVQGGDLGCLTARLIALKYGLPHCKAHHLNNAAPAEPTEATHPELHAKVKATPLDTSELDGLARTARFSNPGYYRLASTKPQTIGYSIADSPVGLLAWIYEKLHDWTDPAYTWTDEEICTWVSIYWFSTPGPAASSRPFYAIENRKPEGAFAAAQAYSDVPLGVARFPSELILLPRLWNQTMGPVVYESEYESGGHFAAWERPDAIVKDLRAMFGRGGGAYGCVSGKNGYDA